MKTIFFKRRPLAAVSILLGACLLSGAWAAGGAERRAAEAASSAARVHPIYSVERGEARVASITINASDGDADTEAILDCLDRYGVKATFFLVGTWVRRYPERVRELATRGHELGNHSDTHPDMTKLSVQAIEREITALDDAVEELTGVRPTLFRAPSGAYNNRVVETARALGSEAVQWDVDSLDWKGYGAADIERRVLKGMQPGSIVLFHINGKGVAEALEAILSKLTADGWEFVPVGELLLDGPYRLDHTGRMIGN